ncbi:MAG: EI24 domain-containing protein [Azoarcus sp.]|jgi:uncharacterized protein involved in cysteine biosynthesis|nr:EI24 domain-containing protein [Azoarcus sp.]
MRRIFIALWRALRSLTQPGIFVHLLWPGVVSALLWVMVAWLTGGALIEAGMNFFRQLWGIGAIITNSEWAAASALFLVKFVVVLGYIPFFYVTTTILVGVVALPLLLERVARRDYASLAQRHGGSNLGSITNTLKASLWYVLMLLVSLPFWAIPGVALVAPVLATGWLNQRIFGYDALMNHANGEELARLREKRRPQMLLLGGFMALFAYVPIVNVIAPAFAGLAFVHFLLDVLQSERGAARLPEI